MAWHSFKWSEEIKIQRNPGFKVQDLTQGSNLEEELLDIQDISFKAIFHYQNIHFTLQVHITKPITQDYTF